MHLVTASMTTRLMRRQLSFLREAGFDVTIVSSPGPELNAVAGQEQVASASVPMEREISPLADLRSFRLLWRQIRRARPALINVGTAKAGLLGGLAAWLCGVSVRIYTLHGIRLETTGGLRRRLLTLAERLSCRCAHYVLCVSQSVRQRAIELGLAPADRLVVLGAGSFNGVDVARFAPTPARVAQAVRIRRELGIPADAPVIGFVGRFTRDKGIAELVQAYQTVRARLPEARLMLLGRFESGDPVPEAARRFLETDLGVTHVGYVPDPAAHYQAMDVLALPTYREGYPTVVLEASAAGKPIVATRATGAVDAVEDGVTGLLVPVGDAAALSDALLRLLEDPELSAAIGAAGRARVERQYTTERVCADLASFYQQLLLDHGVVQNTMRQPSGGAGAAKRLMDVIGAVVALAISGPAMALAALAVWATMGLPVLFRQRRAGRHGRPFWLAKFRTMSDERDGEGRLLPDERRLTPVGRALRRFGIDELPQLWNVLKGEMSLVGPRPLLMEYLPAYTGREQIRHAVRPGITGSSQVNGRHTSLFSRRLELDSWYVENWSLGLDLKIAVQTIPRLLCQADSLAYQDPDVDDRGFWRLIERRATDGGDAGVTGDPGAA
jgi:lipopolysaccharide/colanic/teichoic acid biosynthesis glycosyltransferase/glycosyltransferase involved in cell wall biosynthesis